jgi:photosystem II stability/assembly factor-like uncharacterized protein
MIRSLLSLLFIALLAFGVQAQKEIHSILANAVNFEETVQKAEAYFAKKHPGCTPADLCKGEHRDGDFVKFMRWKAFWSERLNPDGTLGDITAYQRNLEKGNSKNRGGSGLYEDIEWTNLSYENYITMQIGMGRTTSIGFHPTDENTFYVGGAIGGVWKTTDGGQTYEPKGDDLPFLAVSSIVVNANDPQTLYIALSDHVWYGPSSIGVYKSTDGGDTWTSTALSFEFNQNIRINWMIADPSDADRIFIATSSGLYLTDDGFETVISLNSLNCTDVKFKPGDASVVYLGLASGALYKSIEGGINFTPASNIGSGSTLIAVTPLNPELVYVRAGGVMKKSTDSGENFGSAINLPDSDAILIFSGYNSNTLISGWFEVWKTNNGGGTFYPLTNWLGDGGLPLIHVDQRNVFANPLQPELIYLCNDGGVYALNVEEEEFTNLSDGLMITQFYDIAVSQTDEDIIGGGSQDNGNVFRNSNGVWEDYAGTGDGMNHEIDWSNENIRYWSYQLGGLQRNQNGSNAGIAPPGEDGNGAWETPYKVDPNDPSRLICAYSYVYESLNKGNSWTEISPALAGSSDMEQLAIAPSNSNRIYVARSNKIWVKDLFTEEWDQKTLPASGISDLEVDPIDYNTVYVTISGYTDGSKVYRSTNAGEDWENISGSLPNVSTGAIEIYKNVAGGLFVGTDAGVYYRDNTLSDWEVYGNIPNTRVEDIEIQYSGQKIRIGTHGRGVLEAPVNIGLCDDTATDSDEDGICNEFDICANFDDMLLGTPCNDQDPNTWDDVYVNCDLCEGVYFASIAETGDPSLNIYPNPSQGIFTVQSEFWSGSMIKVYDVCGKLIYQEKMNGQTQVVDLSTYPTSVYTLRVSNASNGMTTVRKMAIE